MLSLLWLLFICIYSAGLTMLTHGAASEACTSLHARHLKEYDGKKISQSEKQIFTNLSKIECFAECGRDKYCLSVQLYPDGQTCVTLRERFKNVDVMSTAVPGYQLFQTDKPASTIGADCDLDVDCKSLHNSNCHEGSCRCDVGHRPDGNTCRKDPVSCASSVGYKQDVGSGLCYRIETQVKQNWADAESSCTISQGHLVRPDTQSKQDKLKVLLEQLALESFWIGARHDDGEKEWVWLDNTTASLPWAPGEPSGDGNCADLHRGLKYKTNDASCKDYKYYICEIPQN